MLSMSRISELAASKGVAVVGVATITLAAGFLAGFYYAKHNLEEHYNAKADAEVAEAKRTYSKLYKKDEWESPEAVMKALRIDGDLVVMNEAADALRTYRATQEPVSETGEVRVERARLLEEGPRDLQALRNGSVVVRNIFQEQTEHKPPQEVDFEYADEVRRRSEEAPYIISKDEYFQNEEEFQQSTLTYYVGDGILCDERDDVINEVDETVGDDNLLRFGHRSDDDNVVYVRNHVLEIEYEICKSEGKYAREVAGLE
jgi:hypothetical protein